MVTRLMLLHTHGQLLPQTAFCLVNNRLGHEPVLALLVFPLRHRLSIFMGGKKAYIFFMSDQLLVRTKIKKNPNIFCVQTDKVSVNNFVGPHFKFKICNRLKKSWEYLTYVFFFFSYRFTDTWLAAAVFCALYCVAYFQCQSGLDCRQASPVPTDFYYEATNATHAQCGLALSCWTKQRCPFKRHLDRNTFSSKTFSQQQWCHQRCVSFHGSQTLRCHHRSFVLVKNWISLYPS